jgi:potassium efflux system protein
MLQDPRYPHRARHPIRWWLPVIALLAAGNASGDTAAARRAVEAGRLSAEQQAEALAQLDAADGHEREAAALRAQLTALRAEAQTRPGRIAALRDSLASDRDTAVADWAARLPADTDRDSLERLLDRERRQLVTLEAEIDEITTDLGKALSRPADIAAEMGSLRRRIDALSIAAPDAADEAAPLREARDLARRAELARLRAEFDLRQAEQEGSVERQRLDELMLRERRYRIGLDQRRIDVLETRIEQAGERELEELRAGLIQQEALLEDAQGPAVALARDNRGLGEELVAQNAALARDRREASGADAERARVATTLRDSQARLEIGGTSEAIGRWLWSERRRLENPARLRQRLEAQRAALAGLRLRLVTLSEEQRDLVDIDAATRALLASEQAQTDDEGARGDQATPVEPLLRQRADLLAQLEPIIARRIDTLEIGERALGRHLDDTLELRQLLDRHLLWTPSHGTIDASWFTRLPEGLHDLVKPSRWRKTLELTTQELASRPVRWGASLLLVVAFIVAARRARRALAAAAGGDEAGGTRFLATLQSTGWTLLCAARVPLGLWLLGDLLQSVGNPGKYSDSLGRACATLVLPLFTVLLVRQMTAPTGLGSSHFGWPAARCLMLRRRLPPLAALVLPMYFIVSLAFIRNLDLPNDVQARTAIVIACLALAGFFWSALGAGRGWDRADDRPRPLRRGLRAALPIASLFIAFLALTGYVHSAGLLLEALLLSGVAIVAVSLVTGLAGRWFRLGESRLLRQRLEEQGEVDIADDESGIATSSELTPEKIGAQANRLLRALRLTLLGVALLVVWAQVLPAVARLDEIALWQFNETGADGSITTQPVTLMAVLLGGLVLALTMVGARNLPGLVEIGVLSRTGIDAASRYAFTSVLRYAIVIAGALIGLGLLGMRWSQLQWLAAALTVGLGFGLQEIFANFVSGLILLFERPFRIGDVITVDQFSGRVTRIRTRATTILDFENREIVIPNKNFITGQLTNWTLSDETIRVTIRVGVAYGTDPDKVHTLLLRVAAENPLVLQDPRPISLFMAFGASSLDFELRVFVGHVSDRFPAQNQLNAAIARLFAAEGVEIAFPQLDVHVRDLPRPG